MLQRPISVYGNYFQRWKATGTLTAVNFEKRPVPGFFERSYDLRPGVISIFDSYMTFRFIDLVKNPYITNGIELIPFHRSSLWSQVYGRIHFAYFDQHVWTRYDYSTKVLGSFLMIAGLFPTILLVMGSLYRLVTALFLHWNRQSG